MPNNKKCKVCEEQIPKEKYSNAIYCGSKCRQKQYEITCKEEMDKMMNEAYKEEEIRKAEQKLAELSQPKTYVRGGGW